MTVIDLAGWVAAGATMIAAIMTAANLGARITGWGFVVFLVGALAWILVAMATGQHTLLLSNVFLALVDIFGIWRWLGWRAKLDDGAERAARETAQSASPLFRVNLLESGAIHDRHGATIAHCVGAMAEWGTGRISYVMARTVSKTDHGHYLAIPWTWLTPRDGALGLRSNAGSLDSLAPVEAEAWPTAAGLGTVSRLR